MKPELSDLCELWHAVTGLLLEVDLPMLKGRSRLQYAKEKRISAWFQAVTFASEQDIKQLETCQGNSENRQKRSLSMRVRKEIQKMLWKIKRPVAC